jgi:hypothetical protein
MRLGKNILEKIWYGLYAAYNTAFVSGVDISLMKSVTDWNFVISSGLIYLYNIAFTCLRIAPPLIAYKMKKIDFKKMVNYTQLFLFTFPFQDAFYYGVQGINPVSPVTEKPWHYPWANTFIPVREYFAGYTSAAGLIEIIKRKIIKISDKF